jgi:hypothetical protein
MKPLKRFRDLDGFRIPTVKTVDVPTAKAVG